MYLNLKLERQLWEQGYQRVIGLDEVGRGTLAGPVTVGGVIINPGLPKIPRELQGVRDSKKMTALQRERTYQTLMHAGCLISATASSSARVVDRVGIVRAVELAMIQVVKKLSPADFAILDGDFSLPLSIHQCSLVRADDQVFSVAAASIIAKVRRDRLMCYYHSLYSRYGFQKHKGYGTERHRQAIGTFGFCPIHRKTFKSSWQKK